jgi:phosphoadenosine phosphosulfate reductase
MTVLLELDGARGARVSGEGPAAAPTPNRPRNDGDGDIRKQIAPVVKPPTASSAERWEGGLYVGLAQWIERRADGDALLLQPADDVRDLAGRIDDAPLVAIDFHRIGDGRGYTLAFLLRRRLGYEGRLRAIGAVTADQIYQLASVGFDSFSLRADQHAEPALAALNTFSHAYQGALVAGAAEARAAAEFDAKLRLLERSLVVIARHARPALASSLSAEDMAITDAVARLGLKIDVFTLDTGRLHEETLALIPAIRRRYGIGVEVVRPVAESVFAYEAEHGRNGFYDGVTQRKLCCNIRKVEPLNRALAGRDAWITGQRREQSSTRAALAEKEFDAERNMAKYNPLADWTWADVLAYAKRFDIPMNPLYARGFVSIGCEPCTKAIRPGQDPRDGRWWWEGKGQKECGLHVASAAKAPA